MNKKERKEYNNKYHQDHGDSISNSKKDYYKKNSVILKEDIYRRRKIKINFIDESKNKPCADCGILYPLYVMDFDHRIREDKSFNLSTAAYNGKTLESIKKEILKCDVVCSNCHRERTHGYKNK